MTNDTSWETRDEQISSAIEAEIEARTPPNAKPIDVAVQGATVTLTGYVANEATKEAVIKMAQETPGVVAVIDNLVVGHGHPWMDWFFPWRNPNQDLDAESRGES